MLTHAPVNLLCIGPNVGFVLLRCFILTAFLSSSKSQTPTLLGQSQIQTTDGNSSTIYTPSSPNVSDSYTSTDILNATSVPWLNSTEKFLGDLTTKNIKSVSSLVTTVRSRRIQTTKAAAPKKKVHKLKSGAIVAIIIVPVIIVVLVIICVLCFQKSSSDSYYPESTKQLNEPMTDLDKTSPKV